MHRRPHTQRRRHGHPERRRTTTDGGGNAISYHYNADGNPDKITYPNGHDVTTGYNDAQRATSVTDLNGNTTSFGYDPDGNLTSESYPNGDTATTSYNADSQITGITDTGPGGGTLASFAYTRGGDGETATATTTGTALTAASESYTYNDLGELTGDGTTSYGYNDDGDLENIGASTVQGFSSYDQILNTNIGGTDNTTYTFNPRGDLTTAAAPAGTTSYGYDQANELTTYTPPAGPATSYTYNGQGLRTSTTTGSTTTGYTWDTTTAALPEMLTAGTTSYIYGPDGLPIESVDSSGTPTYYLHDQLGSTRLLTDSTGAVTGTYTYDPWGNTTSHTGTATTPLQYTGQYHDPESGLYYLQHRYYNPATAQFLTIDPLINQTRTPYAYTNDNPETNTDPTGLQNLPVGTSCNPSDQYCQQSARYPCQTENIGCHHPAPVSQVASAVFGSEGAVAGYSLGVEATGAAYGGIYALSVRVSAWLATLGVGTTATAAANDNPEVGEDNAAPASDGPAAGQKVFRVYGGDSQARGASWSPVDPASVPDYRDAAGLPSGGASGATNTGQFVIEGTLNDPSAVLVQRSAEGLDGMKGGLPEYIIPNWLENGSITIRGVYGVNPEF